MVRKKEIEPPVKEEKAPLLGKLLHQNVSIPMAPRGLLKEHRTPGRRDRARGKKSKAPLRGKSPIRVY